MKVGLISIGAFAHYCYCLANALADEGIEVVLYTDDTYSFERYETRFTLKKIIGQSRKYRTWNGKLLADIEGEKPDIVHIQSYRKYLTLDLLLGQSLKRTGVALAFTFHDLTTFKKGLYSYVTTAHHHAVLKYLYLSLFDGFIAHSAAAKNEIQHTYGLQGPRVTVIPHGIMDFYDFGVYTREEARKRLNLAERDFALLYFGNIGRRKGLQDLLWAYTTLKRAGQQRIKLVMAGTGMDYYDKHLRPITDEEEVTLYKDLQRIPDQDIEMLFKAADVVVLPYVESTTSGNLKIAVAFDKPVIATAVGEFPEYVGKYAIDIVRSGDVSGIAESILRLMAGNGKPKETMKNLPGHTWNEIAEKTKIFYGNIVRARDVTTGSARTGRSEIGMTHRTGAPGSG
jgi:glycosyltransferase involved in cell wall biosynthesis